MKRIITTDNNIGVPFDELGIVGEAVSDLRQVANKPISQLQMEGRSDLLIFPPNYHAYGDEIAQSCVCQIIGDELHTGNIMGFVGFRDTSLTIRSRFTPRAKHDYFLYYILSKVLSLNVFELSHTFDRVSILDFLVYLFPAYLEAALQQGLYKEYAHKRYDDMKVKGTIDLARQIKNHTPFNGRLSYNTREHCHDNPITQLIRHTIEYIERHPFASNILTKDESIRSAVRTIKSATPSYSKYQLSQIVSLNIHPLTHPYFTAYADLQRLCLNILRQDGLMYGSDNNHVYGILFDGAWLWEEYLNTVITTTGLIHSENRNRTNRVNLFTSGYPLYPDFYKQKALVLDAKYKLLDNRTNSKDIHQLVCYMHILEAATGGFIYPSAKADSKELYGKLNGLGGLLYKYAVSIPQEAESMDHFATLIAQSENRLKSHILSTLNP